MSLRMSELSGSAYSTPSRNRYSNNFDFSNNDSQTGKTNPKLLSSDVLSNTLSASMKKQTTKSELFDIELEDNDYFKVDQVINEINMLSAKGYAYAANSGLTSYRPKTSQDSYEDSEQTSIGFVPMNPTPTKSRTPKLKKYDLTGKSFFSEPHIYPQKPQSEFSQSGSINEDTGELFGNFEFFRATPIRKPHPLL